MVKTQSEPQFSSQYNKFSPFTVLLTCVYVMTWYMQLGGRVDLLGAIRFEFLIGVTLICLSILGPKSTAKANDNPLAVYLGLYFFTLLSQVALSVDVAHSWNVFFNRILKFSMLALFITSFITSPKALRWFLIAFLLACAKIGSEGFLGWLSGSLMWQNQGIMRLHGPTGNYAHPNSFSGFAVGLLPFLYFLFPAFNKPLKGLLLITVLFTLIIIVYTGSRTGYVGTFAVLAYIFYISKNKKAFLKVVAIVSLIGLSQIPEDYFERFTSIYTGEDKEGKSTEKRIEILRDAGQVFLSHPMGVGIGAFPIVRAEMFGRHQDTHNLYLEILTNIGIHGFIIFSLLIIKLLKLLKSLRSSIGRQIKDLEASLSLNNNTKLDCCENINTHLKDLKLLIAVVQSVSAFIIARLSLGLFGMDLYEIYWWLGVGLAISLNRMNDVALNRTREVLLQAGSDKDNVFFSLASIKKTHRAN